MLRRPKILAALLVLGFAAAVPAQDTQVIFIPTPGVTDATTLERKLFQIADNVAPHLVSLPKGIDLVAELQREYRDAAGAMWSFVRLANGGDTPVAAQIARLQQMPAALLLVDKIDLFILPAGPYWILSPTTTVVQAGDDFAAIARRHLGATSPTELGKARQMLARSNPTLNLASLTAGQKLNLPQTSVPRVVNPTETAAELRRAEDGDRRRDVASENVPGLRPIEALASSESCEARPEKWPLDWPAILPVHEWNRNHRRDFDLERKVVAVLDSGVDSHEFDLNRIPFWRGGDNDFIGRDMTSLNARDNSPKSYPYVDAETRRIKDHGTHVAALIHGGAIEGTIREALYPASKLMVLKVVYTERLRRDSERVDEVSIVKVPTVLDAISYADRFHVPVINLSVESAGMNEGSERMQSEWSVLKKEYANTLFVIAAGNGKLGAGGERTFIDFEQGAHAPADMGGSNSRNVVSVAAHDGKWELAGFSNRGRNHITLAAPGCAIQSYIPGATAKEVYSGTSQAAPLVSLIAAMLAYYDLGAEDIKRRLIASVDLRPKMKVYARGTLNAEKALNVFRDIVELEENGARKVVPCEVRTTTTRNGKPALLFDVLDLETREYSRHEPIDLERVLKITPMGEPTAAGAPVWLVFRPKQGELTNDLGLMTKEGRLTSSLSCRTEQGNEIALTNNYHDIVRRTK